MKKIALCILILGGLLNGFADECKHFWFSQSQQNAQFIREEPTKMIYNFARLKDNRVVTYTAITKDDFSPDISYKDYVYLGCGFFEKTEILDSNNGQYHYAATKPSNEKYRELLKRNIEILNSLDENNNNKFDSLFKKYSEVYNINEDFIKKIAILESGLDENKITKSHFDNDMYVGLFQLSSKYFNIDVNKIDNDEITNKAVKHMRYCIDNKGYSFNMIDCFNKGYSLEVKKELLKILNKDLTK